MRNQLVNLGLFVRLEAKPGKENEVAKLLQSALPLLRDEPATAVWFAIQFGPTSFGVFDAFPDEAGREEHLAGKVAAALKSQASELLAAPPEIAKVDVIASRVPVL
jgi:quinol monooxygenase YgiN